ncbi:MAG: hypothetical protein ACR2KK_09960 [Acidimicrobiales bacterium]
MRPHRSTDAGATWKILESSPEIKPQPYCLADNSNIFHAPVAWGRNGTLYLATHAWDETTRTQTSVIVARSDDMGGRVHLPRRRSHVRGAGPGHRQRVRRPRGAGVGLDRPHHHHRRAGHHHYHRSGRVAGRHPKTTSATTECPATARA